MYILFFFWETRLEFKIIVVVLVGNSLRRTRRLSSSIIIPEKINPKLVFLMNTHHKANIVLSDPYGCGKTSLVRKVIKQIDPLVLYIVHR